jgi:tRNA(fMet)-specific endonuclease VapC
MRYLLDTTFVISGVLGRQHESQSRLYEIGTGHAAISIISLAELYEGPFHTTNPQAAFASLHDDIRRLPVLPITDRTCRTFAELRAHLRRSGNRKPDFDLLIAATAIQHDLTLITKNVRDFVGITGLRVVEH